MTVWKELHPDDLISPDDLFDPNPDLMSLPFTMRRSRLKGGHLLKATVPTATPASVAGSTSAVVTVTGSTSTDGTA